jgi:hypothetical protein
MKAALAPLSVAKNHRRRASLDPDQIRPPWSEGVGNATDLPGEMETRLWLTVIPDQFDCQSMKQG